MVLLLTSIGFDSLCEKTRYSVQLFYVHYCLYSVVVYSIYPHVLTFPIVYVYTCLFAITNPLQIETYYNLNYTLVSLIFLAPFLGYSAAALTNNKVHMKFGQRGVAVIAPFCKIISYVVTCLHPPYPVLPFIFMLAGFGNGLEDGAWNAWVGNMRNANEMLGFLHGCYGLGATISPLIATTMVTKGNLGWYNFYYIMVCSCFIRLIAIFHASISFWESNYTIF